MIAKIAGIEGKILPRINADERGSKAKNLPLMNTDQEKDRVIW